MTRYYTSEGYSVDASNHLEAAEIFYGPGNHTGTSLWSREGNVWIEHVLGSGGADLLDSNPKFTFEGYWSSVLGSNRGPADVVREFNLYAAGRTEIDEWLGKAEADAWAIDAWSMDYKDARPPAEWSEHHDRALAMLLVEVGADQFDSPPFESWVYESYWDFVLGENSVPSELLKEYNLVDATRAEINDWLTKRESKLCMYWARSATDADLPNAWAEYHDRALDELDDCVVE